MFKLLWRLIILVLVLVGLGAVAAGVMLAKGGISARQTPNAIETAIAPRLRSLAVPASAREMKSPLKPSPQIVADGMEHFADHCAVCHGNDGSGDTEMGRALYPRVPDMRKPATQDLSDGELYYIIQNGVRFTGMPGWAHEDPQDNWKLVQFIRHLPQLTPAELTRMQGLNPKAPDEKDEKDEKDEHDHGNAAKPDAAKPAAPHQHTHSHGRGGH